MSRTDKTKPWRVRVAEHTPLEIHNHETGVCNLPESPLSGRLGMWTRQHCSWSDWNISYRNNQCCHGCGCRICTGYYWRRSERRRTRHQATMTARTIVATNSWQDD